MGVGVALVLVCLLWGRDGGVIWGKSQVVRLSGCGGGYEVQAVRLNVRGLIIWGSSFIVD